MLEFWAIYFSLGLVVAAVALYSSELLPMEYVSLGIVLVLLVVFAVFPTVGVSGQVINSAHILKGFADNALFAVLAMLIIGQGIVHTGCFEALTKTVVANVPRNPGLAMGILLLVVLALSGFLNNTPIVVVFIPIFQELAARYNQTASKFMMPLSFVAILGGMTTLIGSSTNLLVSSSLEEVWVRPLGFFEFLVPGGFLAAVGFLYVLLFSRLILPERTNLSQALFEANSREFIAQLVINDDSDLVGEKAKAGMFPVLKELSIRAVWRGEHAELPPFDDITLRAGDVLVVAATRKRLVEILGEGKFSALGEAPSSADLPDEKSEPGRGEKILAEAMVVPASRLIGSDFERLGFRRMFNCIIVGLQRRSRMIQARMTQVPLHAGDILLVMGNPTDIARLNDARDFLLIKQSSQTLPNRSRALWAGMVFLLTVVTAASGLLPVTTAAMCGAAAMLFGGAINLRQARRAIDHNLYLLIGASLALGFILQETGTAHFLARNIALLQQYFSVAVILSMFFLLVALSSSMISNNACAVLFTPIAVNLAESLGSRIEVFAIAVVLAANCCFTTPIGYQTNLLVMGPGHYRFGDFLRFGLPLTVLLWLAFSLFAPWYYQL